MRRRLLPGLALCLAFTGCGSSEPMDSGVRESVARRFDADCRSADAPTAEAARDLERLCSCAGRRIRASDIAAGDSADLVTRKIQRVTEACTREIYGDAPAEGDSVR